MSTTTPARQETWNLDDLFADEAEFQRSKVKFRDESLPSVEPFRGRLLESAATLADALEAVCATGKQLQRLRCYATLKSDSDTRVAAHQALRQEIEILGTDLSQRLSYLRPEILAASPDTIDRFLSREPRLESHAHFLRDLMRQREHVLGPAEERIMAESGLVRREAGSLYEVLVHAELPRPEVSLSSGETVRLTTANFHKHRTTTHRGDRRELFREYFGSYATFRETLGRNLYAAVKSHLFGARSRNYSSCLAAALNPDNVPETVYRNLIEQVRERRAVQHRYCRLRARALDLETLEYPDLYCPIAPTPEPRIAPREARERVIGSLAPLGGDYVEPLQRAFDERWIDWQPTPGKRSGAYATGWAYDVHPYVLLNFNGDHESVLTLTHEMGHAMHSFFSSRAQPYATADYSIFVAEVASTFNEALLSRHAMANASSPEEKLFLLGSYMDRIRATLFRQTMFAEFELEIHERAERGEVLTGEKLSDVYLNLLREYQGHPDGVMDIGEEFAIEWAAVPHFYYGFYVYQYATGIVAAHALARSILEGDADSRDRYLRFLQSGGSDDSLDLLRSAGVDLESSEPYDQAFAEFESQLDSLERALDERDRG